MKYRDRYKVYSSYSSESEPHLEATFPTELEAQQYIDCWQSLYDKVEFWLDSTPDPSQFPSKGT